MSELVSLQGSLFLAERTAAGKPGRQWWAGNVEGAAVELGSEKITLNESFSGQRAPYGTLPGAKTGRFTGTFTEWKAKNLALGLHSKILEVVTGSITGELLPAGLAVGDIFSLDHPFADDLVITDSTGTPVVVPAGTFGKEAHAARSFKVLSSLSTFTQPLKAAYTHEAYEELDVFSEISREIYVIFDGINTENGKPYSFDLFKTKFDAFTNLGLIHEEYGKLEFGTDVLIDPLNFNSEGKGGFIKMRRQAAT